MKNLAIAVAAAFIFALGSCAENVGQAVHYAAKDKDMTASGNIVAKSFAVGDFEKIRAGGVFKVVYTPAEGKSKVEVRTSDNVMPFVSVGVKDGTLQLRLNHNGTIKKLKTLEVSVASPSLSGIALSGAAKGEISRPLKAKSFEARLSGASRLEADKVQAGNFEARLSGASKMDVESVKAASAAVRASGSSNAVMALEGGNAELRLSGASRAVVEGKAAKAVYTTSGAASVDAAGCVATDVVATASGASTVKCHATEKLNAKRSGASKISYKGSAKLLGGGGKGIRKL